MWQTSRLEENVRDLTRIEARDQHQLRPVDRVADAITTFSGSMLFVFIHAIWFSVWIGLNEGPFAIRAFDVFPYGLLTMLVSLEAIFLSTFVLISENRQARQADRREKVDLHVNMIAEQEITKLIAMVAEIQEHLGIEGSRDADVQQMEQPIRVAEVADAVDAAEPAARGESRRAW